eukprot:TRINITY_DN26530_c2_g1_i1.p1 TRINITY_DN26530_c2_g1~~TRINITY_DN26530_c2_g1_i1.p1  ORF type:complete len:621 (+),score=142.02 TRINITY_DN26530_c2_g1_i1:242-2104(+)
MGSGGRHSQRGREVHVWVRSNELKQGREMRVTVPSSGYVNDIACAASLVLTFGGGPATPDCLAVCKENSSEPLDPLQELETLDLDCVFIVAVAKERLAKRCISAPYYTTTYAADDRADTDQLDVEVADLFSDLGRNGGGGGTRGKNTEKNRKKKEKRRRRRKEEQDRGATSNCGDGEGDMDSSGSSPVGIWEGADSVVGAPAMTPPAPAHVSPVSPCPELTQPRPQPQVVQVIPQAQQQQVYQLAQVVNMGLPQMRVVPMQGVPQQQQAYLIPMACGVPPATQPVQMMYSPFQRVQGGAAPVVSGLPSNGPQVEAVECRLPADSVGAAAAVPAAQPGPLYAAYVDRIPPDSPDSLIRSIIDECLKPQNTTKVQSLEVIRNQKTKHCHAFVFLSHPPPKKLTSFPIGSTGEAIRVQASDKQRSLPVEPSPRKTLHIRVYAQRKGWSQGIMRMEWSGLVAILEDIEPGISDCIRIVAHDRSRKNLEVHKTVCLSTFFIECVSIESAKLLRSKVHDRCAYAGEGVTFLVQSDFTLSEKKLHDTCRKTLAVQKHYASSVRFAKDLMSNGGVRCWPHRAEPFFEFGDATDDSDEQPSPNKAAKGARSSASSGTEGSNGPTDSPDA